MTKTSHPTAAGRGPADHEVRNQIVTAATEHFSRYGYEKTTVSDLAKEIGFSKAYDDDFNPKSGFAAIMTCSQADGGCPFIAGAEKRIPITFEDPKISDGTPQQKETYLERSLQIGTEMFYVFSQIKK